MAITIRNKAIEDAIRIICLRTGESPDAVIDRLVHAEAIELGFLPAPVSMSNLAERRGA